MTILKATPSTETQSAITKVASLLVGLASGTYRGTDFTVSQTSATGTVRMKGVGEKGVGVVEITVGTAAPVVVPVGGLSDADAADAVATALNADTGASQFVSAKAEGDTVLLTAKEAGPAGNSVGIFALTDYGAVIQSGPFLSGGDSLISML